MRRRGRASASLQAPRGCCALLHREASEVYEVAECGGSSHAAAARLIVVAFKGPRGLLAQGTPLHVASEILGHASITITKDVYGHLVEGDRRAVAASMSQEAPRAETNTPSIGWRRGRQCWPCLCGESGWRGLRQVVARANVA